MPVKPRALKQVGTKYGERRRGRRMNSHVHVRLEWNSGANKRHSVETHTLIVNPFGCMVVLADSLELEQRVSLTNLTNNASNAAVVVWKGNQQPEGWEYGVELVAPDMDFWGLDL